MAERVDLVVVGGGISGLAGAWEATRAGASVTVVEPARPGGKLRTSPFAGGLLDEGADAFLARLPEGVELCRQLGLEGDLVSPAARSAYVWSHGALRLLPMAQLLGVPTDVEELAASGIVSPAAVERARRDLTTPLVAPGSDVTIGSLLRERLGDEVLERLVDPLVGGINAGDCDALSLAATLPQLDAAARSGAPSLIQACAAQRASVDTEAPVFLAPRGGMGALADRLVTALADAGTTFVERAAAAVERGEEGWTVRLDDRAPVEAHRLLLATPAGASAALLRPLAPRAATLLAAVPYASVVLVALAVRRADIDRDLDGSGYLVPRVERRLLTACSWVSSKWPHTGSEGDVVWLRASAGRDGDDRALRLDDTAVVGALVADLRDTMGLRGDPLEARVSRWPGSFPQYRPGHLDRVDAIEADLAAAAPGVAVTGAALRGLGVPACIRQARSAARDLLG